MEEGREKGKESNLAAVAPVFLVGVTHLASVVWLATPLHFFSALEKKLVFSFFPGKSFAVSRGFFCEKGGKNKEDFVVVFAFLDTDQLPYF